MNYKYHIFCCVNERVGESARVSCKKKKSHLLRNYMKEKVKEKQIENVRVNQSGCLDQCENGPVVVVYPQGIWYRCSNFEDVDEIIKSLETGEIVERLKINT